MFQQRVFLKISSYKRSINLEVKDFFGDEFIVRNIILIV